MEGVDAVVVDGGSGKYGILKAADGVQLHAEICGGSRCGSGRWGVVVNTVFWREQMEYKNMRGVVERVDLVVVDGKFGRWGSKWSTSVCGELWRE